MCRLVFLGPSLDVQTARGILEDAIYLPPLRQADLLSAIYQYQPSAIGIIDGYFLQDLSPWHKEILYALQRGIVVYGSSSMGALRAAEMAHYGMRGVGEVFQAFATGTLTDDDEVALAHAPEELAYEKHSEPMVNIRATLGAALSRKVISAAVHDLAIETAKTLYFPERNLPRLVQAWRASDLSESSVETLYQLFRLHYVDIKRDDAIALLKTMANDPNSISPSENLVPPCSLPFDTLQYRDRRSHAAPAQPLTGGIELAKIFRFAAIHCPDFGAIQAGALHRKIVALFAANLGLVATPEQIDEVAWRFRAGLDLCAGEAFRLWLRENDLTEEEFLQLMGENATCRLVQQWWLSVAGYSGSRSKLILDELRLNDRYRSVAQQASQLNALTAETLLPDFSSWTAEEAAPLFREHARRTGFRLDVPVQQWAREAGYFSYPDLLTDVYLSQVGRGSRQSQKMAD